MLVHIQCSFLIRRRVRYRMGHLCLSFGPSRQSGCWFQYFLFLFLSVLKMAWKCFTAGIWEPRVVSRALKT